MTKTTAVRKRVATEIKEKTIDTIQYSVVNIFYWSAICCSMSFASVFLLSRHFRNSQIGFVFAVSNILAAFLQPAVAAFADRTQKISLKKLTAMLAAAAGVLAVVRYFLSDSFGALAVVFVLELAVLFTVQPLVNALGVQMINQGVDINFGLARGTGSLTFAVFSILLGTFVERFGADFLPAVSAALYVLFSVSVLAFAGKGSSEKKSGEDRPGPENTEREKFSGLSGHEIGSFIRQNKKFFLLMVAVSLIFSSHSMINSYMIQITKNIGGTAGEMGMATGIAAAVELPAMALFTTLAQKIRCSSILKFSMFFFVVKAGITLAAANIGTLYTAQFFQCCSFALFVPSSVYYVNRIVRRSDLAKGQAFMTSAETLGGVMASIFGGVLLDGPGVGGMLLAGLIASAVGFVIGLFSTEKVDI